MDYTQNFHLPQWEKTDRIHHDDFNAAFSAIDAALAAKPYVTGAYTGDNANKESGGQAITLGFHPSFVIVTGKSTSGFVSTSGAITEDNPSQGCGRLTDSGFSVWKSSESLSGNLNFDGFSYFYIAFR